jgi:hypothetical protein
MCAQNLFLGVAITAGFWFVVVPIFSPASIKNLFGSDISLSLRQFDKVLRDFHCAGEL